MAVSLRTVYTAMSAVMAQQARLDAASSNVANVNTPGYARRRLLLAPLVGQVDGTGVAAGGGVEAVAVNRMLDHMLQAQVHYQSGKTGASDTLLQGLELTETAVARGTADGFLAAINGFFDAVSTVASDPGLSSPRRLVMTKAQALCDEITQTRSDLNKLLVTDDVSLQADVKRANQLAARIAELNTNIGASPNASASLEDSRDQAMAELAELTGAVGIARENGTVDVLIGGHYLVEAGLAQEFEVVDDTANPGLHTISFRGETPPSSLDGRIAGRLQAREQGFLPALQELDSFTARFADAVNAVHSAGYALDGATTGMNLFEYDPSSPGESIRVNAAMVADPDLLAAATSPSSPGDGTNAVALADLRSIPPGGATTTLTEDYAGWLSAVGADANTARMSLDTDTDVLDALASRQAAISGVSLDEEAVALQEAQRAFVAAQRSIEIALEMMDAVLAMGP